MTYLVAVRTLCEFTAKHGDLDLRFTPSPSAQEGIAGHALVASRRGADYEAEVSLEGSYQSLRVRGRADGFDAIRQQLEEVKTFRGDLHAISDNRRQLHWAQAKIYGHLLCQSRQLEHITLSLVYFDVANLTETVLSESATALSLQTHFDACCEKFLAWARLESAHRAERDTRLSALAFPYASFRAGQRELAEAVYRTSQSRGCLMAQATTGIGKTVGTLFPLLKGAPTQQLDKLFFLAAKTPGRQLALSALLLLRQSPVGHMPLPLRVLELVARDKACEHPDKACHGESCPLAKGFYDRLPLARGAAMQEAAGSSLLTQAVVRNVALTHRVCPYYLSQELVRWVDVVVGDYNYYFDSNALLHAMTTTYQWKVAVLVDEAHNLVARARSMYTATLTQTQVQQVYVHAPVALRGLLRQLNRAVSDMHQTQQTPYAVVAELPASLMRAVNQTLTGITEFLLANPTRTDAELQSFYFEALHFSRMADVFGPHSLLDITLRADGGMRDMAGAADCAFITIRNVVPAPFLAPRFAAAQSTVLFSATLSPATFYQTILGLPETTRWLDVPSPFSATQLRVYAVQNVSSRFQDRTQSMQTMVDLMQAQFDAQPGNYLVFTSSYDYLEQLLQALDGRQAGIPTWAQSRHMSEADRDQFLARFTAESSGIGFAVLGGAFAEGIDLPGTRLIGAFIATLGMPQVNAINAQMKLRMATCLVESGPAAARTRQEQFAASRLAHCYTFLYPGLQKVVQAAGRVIRTTADTGVVYLMDDRFTRPDVMALLPTWWSVDLLQAAPRRVPATPSSEHPEQH